MWSGCIYSWIPLFLCRSHHANFESPSTPIQYISGWSNYPCCSRFLGCETKYCWFDGPQVHIISQQSGMHMESCCLWSDSRDVNFFNIDRPLSVFIETSETLIFLCVFSQQGMSPYPGSERGNGVESNETSSSLGGGGSNSSSLPRGLKRPSLPGTDYHSILELEKPSTVLYDYSKLNAW